MPDISSLTPYEKLFVAAIVALFSALVSLVLLLIKSLKGSTKAFVENAKSTTTLNETMKGISGQLERHAETDVEMKIILTRIDTKLTAARGFHASDSRVDHSAVRSNA